MMSAVTVRTPPWGRPLSASDFFALGPARKGQRWELIDGVLVVSPSPLVPHQDVQAEIWYALKSAAPDGVKVYAAPLDVRLSEDTVVEPDIVVVRAADASGPRLTGLPLLVVEILSDSTRGNDLLLKRAHYERAGIGSYWIVEPVSGQFTFLDLGADGTYTITREGVLGAGPVSVDRPFPVSLTLDR